LILVIRLCLILSAVALFGSCQRPREDLEIYVPSDAIAVAGIHLDQIRSAEWYRALPVPENFGGARYVMAAYNGKDLLFIAKGRSARPDLSGSPAAVHAAEQQRATRKTGAPDLLAQARGMMNKPIWVVARGGRPLPLSGNLANLNTLLQLTEYTTVSARFDSGIDLEAAGLCGNTDAASKLEETVRGMVTLESAAAKRDPDLATLLRSVQVRRDGATVQVKASTTVAAVEKLLR
jgi:hypothetical protein